MEYFSEGQLAKSLLYAHAAWVVVLAKLEQLAECNPSCHGDTNRVERDSRFAKWQRLLLQASEDTQFQKTFQEGLQISFEPEFEAKWIGLFTRGRLRHGPKGGGPDRQNDQRPPRLRTVYELRAFYGLEAPNNLAQRFVGLLNRESVSNPQDRRSSGASKYDAHIRQWGNYALNLVFHNGGWKHFLSVASLSALRDFWPSAAIDSSRPNLASHLDSFVQRVIALANERYIMILANPVGVLWPLWFLRDRANMQLLREIDAQDMRLGPSIPDAKADLFIDINTLVGSMAGLPYPFGYADQAIRSSSNDQWRFWQKEAMQLITHDLLTQYWSPPILFGTRPDLLLRPGDSTQNHTVAFVKLAGPCRTFASVYLTAKRYNDKTSLLQLDTLRICSIPKGWSEPLVDRIKQTAPPDSIFDLSPDQIDRLPSLRVDLVFSHFPIDLAIHSKSKSKYRRLCPSEIYKRFTSHGEDLDYILPATILAGGAFLSRQPFSRLLIQDLARYIGKVDALFHHLSPPWDSLPPQRNSLFDSSSIKDKQRAADEIATACLYYSRRTPIFPGSARIQPDLRQILTKIGVDMAAILFSKQLGDDVICQIKQWAWARLLEQVQYTEVFLSLNLFT